MISTEKQKKMNFSKVILLLFVARFWASINYVWISKWNANAERNGEKFLLLFFLSAMPVDSWYLLRIHWSIGNLRKWKYMRRGMIEILTEKFTRRLKTWSTCTYARTRAFYRALFISLEFTFLVLDIFVYLSINYDSRRKWIKWSW